MGADDVVGRFPGNEATQHLAHRLGELLEADRVLHHSVGGGARDGLVVREKDAGLGEVALGFLVITTDDRIVRALEETVLAVFYEFHRGVFHVGVKSGNRCAGDDHGGADVVLGLNFSSWSEVLADAEGAPGIVLGEADTEILGDEALAAVAEFVAGQAVDEIDGEAFPPVIAPVRFIEALDNEDEVADRAVDGLEPCVVVVGERGVLG